MGRSFRYLFSVVATGALFAGCGPAVPPPSEYGSVNTTSARRATTDNGWLYVANDAFSVGIVYVFGFPDPYSVRTKAIEKLGYVYGPCADSSGHVWIPAHAHGGPAVFEFKAGGTKSIAKLDLPRKTGIGACAVDPVTGNLAVVGTASVNVFANAEGNATNYSLGDLQVVACTYDGQGNLFVDGAKPVTTSHWVFALYELPKGAKTFTAITLDKRVGSAGGLQWDGTDIALATGGDGIKPVIYRVSVSGSKGTVVQSVHLSGLTFNAWFALADGEVAGTSGLYGPRIRVWRYPAGGNWQWELRGFQTEGMAIAVVSS